MSLPVKGIFLPTSKISKKKNLFRRIKFYDKIKFYFSYLEIFRIPDIDVQPTVLFGDITRFSRVVQGTCSHSNSKDKNKI